MNSTKQLAQIPSNIQVCHDCGANENDTTFYKWVDKEGRSRTENRCAACKKARRICRSLKIKTRTPDKAVCPSLERSVATDVLVADSISANEMSELMNVFLKLRRWKNEQDWVSSRSQVSDSSRENYRTEKPQGEVSNLVEVDKLDELK